MNTNPTLCERIKHYRTLYGMTQEEFALELGVESLHISNLERGKKGVSFDMLAQICKRFDIGIAELFPDFESESADLKKRWIAEILKTLEDLDTSQVGMVKTMVCSLKR